MSLRFADGRGSDKRYGEAGGRLGSEAPGEFYKVSPARLGMGVVPFSGPSVRESSDREGVEGCIEDFCKPTRRASSLAQKDTVSLCSRCPCPASNQEFWRLAEYNHPVSFLESKDGLRLTSGSDNAAGT